MYTVTKGLNNNIVMAREFLRKEAVEQEKSHISTAGNFADPQQKLCIGKYRWEEVV